MIKLLRNKPIIINSDLDGIFSGLLLKKYLNCKVVGFTNSDEFVWFNESLNIAYSDVCFVDIFMSNPDVISIDQHIIAVNNEHLEKLSQNSNKINPNLLNPRFHIPNSSYRKKYPFGTVHFIIALLEKERIDLGDLNLKNTLYEISLIDALLRADDTMKTTVDSRYMTNASEWWNWLKELSGNGKTILNLINYLDSVTPENSVFIKKNISEILKSKPFNCDSSDGGVFNLTNGGYLTESAKKHFQFLADLCDIEVFDLNANYKKFKGISERIDLTKQQTAELISSNTIKNKRIFSYAFVKSNLKKENLSVTFYQTMPSIQ